MIEDFHQRAVIRLPALAIFALILLSPTSAAADPVVILSQRVASGADAASIQATVDQFRADLGNPNNVNAVGPLPSGRREINWDGGGAAASATIFPNPMTTFNSPPATRGAVFTTPGTGFEISGQPTPEFGDINPTYPATFTTFSSPRLFTPLGSNLLDVIFFVPGTNTPALVSGFGAVFTDVDLANTTSLEFFDLNNVSLGLFHVPTFNNGLSFLGVTFSEAVIARVRITSGNTPLGPNDGGAVDVVVMDDFLYSEPQPIPEPATLLLFGTGLAGVGAAVRKRRRARKSEASREERC